MQRSRPHRVTGVRTLPFRVCYNRMASHPADDMENTENTEDTEDTEDTYKRGTSPMIEDSTLPLSQGAVTRLISEALSRWGIESSSATVIRHNENLACRVDGPDGSKYLLRICLPRTARWIGMQQDLDALRSELLWIEALRRTTGLRLQRPVPSQRGVEIEEIPHPDTGKPVPCMLLTWIDGEMFTQKEAESEALAREFGRVQAMFHGLSRSWRPPDGFRRPIYDEAALAAALPEMERGAGSGIIRPEDILMVRKTSLALLDLMTSLPRTPKTWGMIHADWVGNLVVTSVSPLSMVPIDFSLSGFVIAQKHCAQFLRGEPFLFEV